MSNPFQLDWLVQAGVLALLCGLAAYLAQRGIGSFNDGVRPLLPELYKGSITRRELAARSYRLSIGFVLSLGISYALAFEMLNPWLLFLPADVIGVYAARGRTAAWLGGLWGAMMSAFLQWMPSMVHELPISMTMPLQELYLPVLLALCMVPFLAIQKQFGWKRLVISLVIGLGASLLLAFTGQQWLRGLDVLQLFSISMMLSGTVLHMALAAYQDRKGRAGREAMAAQMLLMHEEPYRKLKRSIPLYMLLGGLLALSVHLHWLGGTEVSIPLLYDAWQDEAPSSVWLASIAAAEWMRAVSFVPLLVMTALTTGAYGIAGLTMVLPIGYLAPNPVLAVLIGMGVIAVEVLLLTRIVKLLYQYPTIRESTDYLRSSLHTMMELGVFIGSVLAVVKLSAAPYSPAALFIFMLLYAVNEAAGKPIMRIAIGPVGVIMTALLLNGMAVLGW